MLGLGKGLTDIAMLVAYGACLTGIAIALCVIAVGVYRLWEED